MIKEAIDGAPLLGSLIVTVGIVLACNELGYILGARHKSTKEHGGHPQVVSITGAHLGLLAFILAFSFSMAAGHYSDRKELLLADVNAIKTAYLRAGLVAQPESDNIKSLLVRYAATRAATSTVESVIRAVAESEVIQGEIWAEIRHLPEKEKLTVLDSLLVQAVNELFVVHEKRLSAGVYNRIPASIWLALYVILILSMTGMGFSAGLSGKRSPVASIALALSFSMVMYLIADLDRPVSGLVLSDQSIMMDLEQRLEGAE